MRKILTIFGLLLMLASCSSTKDIAYFQDVEHGATINVAHKQLT
ncbi:MAG: lipoprotein, partial [Bacteroidaceae bacterium]|nr:lipoprotein [Bacteroidaceae bacterium]